MDAETRRGKFATFEGAIQADSRRAGFASRPRARLDAEILIRSQGRRGRADLCSDAKAILRALERLELVNDRPLAFRRNAVDPRPSQ
jgi:hypothetical protein